MIHTKVIKLTMAIAIAYAGTMFASGWTGAHNVYAAEPTTKKSKKVPAMRNRVYAQLARAQKLADEGDKLEGFAVLEEVKYRIDQLNSYERAMLFNFFGFMYYGNDDIDNAVESFEQVIAQEAIPDTLFQSTLYSLAQLSMQKQAFDQAIGYLKQWQTMQSKPLVANQHIVFAQAYYQNKDYQQAIEHITSAMALSKAENVVPKENWLILQRAAYYELQQPRKVTEVLETMVKLYQKPQYWLQLAAMYGEIGEEAKQLATMEAAWQAGYVTKEADIAMLAQLYLFNQLPYKAAYLLEEAIGSGQLVADEKRIQMMAQAYINAKEDEKAIPVLKKGAELADDGRFDEQLAQAYLNMEKWRDAIKAAKRAVSRGNLANEGNMYLAQGMAHYNLQEFSESLTAFDAAKEYSSASKTATQWLAYVSKEKSYQERLVMNN